MLYEPDSGLPDLSVKQEVLIYRAGSTPVVYPKQKRAPTTKREFYERYECGEFGNKPLTWNCWEDFLASDYYGPINIRPKFPGGKLVSLATGIKRERYYSNVAVNEAMPDDKIVIQGNVWLGPELRLEYSCEPNILLRDATKQPYIREARGLTALLLLKQKLMPSDYSELMLLIELYPEAIIEFAAYSVNVGTIPNRRMVIFEVRNY